MCFFDLRNYNFFSLLLFYCKILKYQICYYFLYQGLSRVEYEAKKQVVADEITSRLEKKLFPGLRSSIDFMEVWTKTSGLFFSSSMSATSYIVKSKFENKSRWCDCTACLLAQLTTTGYKHKVSVCIGWNAWREILATHSFEHTPYY